MKQEIPKTEKPIIGIITLKMPITLIQGDYMNDYEIIGFTEYYKSDGKIIIESLNGNLIDIHRDNILSVSYVEGFEIIKCL